MLLDRPAELLLPGEDLGLPACLHQLFEGRVEAEPFATALVDGRSRISYRELDRRANRLAHRLRELGAGPEVRVAVCLERTADLIVALLAVLKAGGAYVPVDPAYPAERQGGLLTDSGAAILITRESLLRHLPATEARLVCLDAEREELARRSDSRLATAVQPSNLAYLIYTSGSTGRPKAVAIEHRSAVALLEWSVRTYRREDLAGVLASTSVCFDLSVFEIFTTLAVGGSLILAENALALPSLPAAGEVTLINTVPSAAAELAASGGIPASVRIVNLAGEPLRSALVERLYRLGHVEAVYNLYGPSEDTTYSTWALIRRGDPLPPSIGVPVDGTSVHLLDREMRPAGPGEEGELCLGGAGLARGYLGRPELTAQRFVPDPFAESPGERLYATGDLARFRPTGELDYLGRIDHQVKIRGFRIELGEIEAALDRVPGVAAAVVVARETEAGDTLDKVLVAYVVPAPGATLEPAALRAHLAARLTEAMLPSRFVVLSELPLQPNGKVDRKALPAPEPSADPGHYLPPRAPLEEALAEIWAEVLDVRRVGIDDDFFALGGHSLLATRILSRVRRALGVELPQRVLFENPTIAGLARALEAASVSGTAGAAPALEPAPRDGRGLPLSFAQGRLWLLDRLDPGSPVYNEPLPLALSGALDRHALETALDGIVRRHEVLRTRFAERAGQPVQIVEPAVPFVLPLVDLTSLDAVRRSAEAGRLRAEEAAAPFDLTLPRMLRARLLRLEEDEHHLLVTFHHIAIDGWSFSILLHELSVLYAACVGGEPAALPEMPFQYADFAAWQRRWLGAEMDGQLAFWRERLAGVPDLLELPTDRPRPAVRSLRGDLLDLDLSAELTRSLVRLAGCEGATLFMVLLAAFEALLFRLTGQESFLVGSPIANRNRQETEGLVGFFVNTLALHADVTGAPGFRELLRRTREVTLEAYAHQDLPFDRLVEELRPDRSLASSPLLQVMLVVQNAPEGALELPGIAARSLPAGNRTAKLDLTVVFEQRRGGLAAFLEYATDLFDAPTAARFGRHFETLLAGVAARPEARLDELPLLTPGETQQVLLEWNDVRTAWPREACLHELVEEHAERTPDAVAVICGEVSLTYRDLSEKAATLAQRLRRCGVGPDVCVAVLLERSAELVVALLAVLKAGGAFVPLDPGAPRERLDALMEESQARALIAGPDLEVRPLRAGDDPSPLAEPRPDHLAYVMFTSGTTGRPKGVAVPHRAVVRLVRDTNFARFGPGEVLLLLAPVSFDASTLEIWGALANGGRLVIYPDERPTLEGLGAVLERYGVSTLWLTAGLFHQMVERNLQGLRPVRQLLAGGDVLSPRHVRMALEGLPGCTVINGYGPTENTTFTCCHPMTEAAAVGEPVPIGRPIANSRAVVVDRAFRPAPVGVPGELLAGGDGLARGYLNRPDLTAERFVPDPTAGLLGAPGDRVYRTGDLVRLLPDGRCEFLGRIDQQVKVRGFRIEPGEIETALAAHPAVAAAVVMARPTRDGLTSDRRLVAYVVPHPGRDDAALRSVLRDFLRDRLPEPMVPTAWVFLDELPLTPRGKVDRRALPEPEAAREETAEIAAPRTPTEEVVAGFWSEVLGGVSVGLHDGFFELGGHSLLATQVISRVRETFGVELPLRRLFERPTLGGFAEAVDEALRGATGVVAPGIEPVPRSGPLPLSFAQRRLWFLDQLAPGAPVYNVPYPLRLTGDLDTAALQRALSAVVRRHEALRTTFPATAGEPRQEIEPPRLLPLPRIDLAGLPADAREAEALRLLREDARAPFDLAAGPLLRAHLLRLAPREHQLLLTLHHIVADGWSMEILLRELAALYRGASLPELPVQYADFAVWQQRWLSEEALAPQLAYWRRQLAGVPAAPELPADHPRPAVQSQRGALLTAPLPPALVAGLRALCRREGVTLFMAALAGLDTLLLRFTRQEDLTVGSVVANRNRAETEELIGFFVNTLVLRTDLAGDPAFRGLLGRVRETALAAYGHQDVPFETLVEELHPERDLARTPFFQILIHHIHRGAETVEMAPGLQAGRLPADTGTAKFDLSLTVVDSAEAVELHLEYATDLFEAATIRRLFGHLTRLLTEAAARPDLPLSALPLLAPEEATQILVDWNDTACDFGNRSLVHEQVAEQARRHPGALAVAAGPRHLTYGELAASAHRLAHHLRSLGVGPESRVAVLMERTPERVIGILAVLQAGGAYVSLDPAHPRDRLAFQIADAKAPVVLTQKDLATRLPALVAELLVLDGDWNGIHGREDAPPAIRIEPENLAYVVYTSGSTGTPKGVEIAHAGLANLVAWHREEYGVTAADRATLVANPAFDASVWEVWPYLTAGASLHIPEEEIRLAPAALAQWWAASGITLSFLPTPLAEAVLEEELPTDLALRALIVGGDRLRRGPVPGARFRLMNHYGPSESSVVSTMGPVEEPGIPSIGRPIANTRVYVLDAGGAPVPVGVPGELWVAGTGLARGYLARPDLTAERFLPDPWSSGERMYRTGDLVRWRPHGDLDFLGRLDHQVKVRGLRIELGEIEAALHRLPEVREAVVLAREDASGDPRLVAWIVPAAEEAPASGELRRALLLGLPEYMVPATFVTLTALPLTPNGKLDRRALPDPEPDREEGSFAAPRGPVEELVAALWCEVLGRDRVAADASFFELGGHSLLAIQVVSRLRTAFGVDLPVRALFEAPTVSRLAERIAAARSGPTGIDTPPLRPTPREIHAQGLPLSFAQGRLWLLDRLAPGTAIFNVPQPLALRGPLDRPALEAALTEIVRRHEVLRTVFHEHEGSARQVVQPAGPVALPLADLAALPSAGKEAEARRLADLEARQPFDLASGPLVRTTLLRLAPEEHVLLLTMHHIVTDGWSMTVFTRELQQLYAAFTAGRPSPLPEPPLQYADFAAWQRRFLDGGGTAALLDRWRGRFGTELPLLRLPTDRPRPPVQTSPGAWLTRELPPELSAEIRALSRRAGATLFMTLLAAFQALLAHLTGQEKIVVGTPVAGRDHAEIEGLIGFFVNSLVLPADLTGDPTFNQILDRVRDMALDAYACQELPFEKLVEALQPERDRSRTPLFQVMFALETEAAPAGQGPLALTPFPVETGTSQFDLTLYMTETPDSLSAVVEYNTDLFDAATIEKLLENYRRLLAAAVAQPDTRLSALPPAPEARPRPTPAPALSRRAAPSDPAERRARLQERRSHLSEEQRRQLEQRLRGNAPAATTAPPTAARCLVEITPAAGATRPPFFCVHPAGGDVLCFFPLARHLGPDQPFFGLQARGLEDDAEPFATLEEMAACYVSEMRRLQPTGPYHLGGWSFGGLAAYEMARQLAEQGQEVALLAVLDTAPGVLPEEPEDPTLATDDDTPWLLVIADYVQGLRGADLGVTADHLAPLAPEERLRTFVDRLRAAGIVHAGDDGLAQLRRLLKVFKTDAKAYRAYRPTPYPGPITLFRATGSPFDPSLGPDLGWSRLTPRPVEVHHLPGDHLTMMADPGVATLAERLRICLE